MILVWYSNVEECSFGSTEEHILWDNIYVEWSVCMCACVSADKSNDNADCESASTEEEAVTF